MAKKNNGVAVCQQSTITADAVVRFRIGNDAHALSACAVVARKKGASSRMSPALDVHKIAYTQTYTETPTLDEMPTSELTVDT